MKEDKLREQFEAWFNENYWNPLADPEDGEGNCDGFLNRYDEESNEYQEDHTNEMWFAWQACAKIKDAEWMAEPFGYYWQTITQDEEGIIFGPEVKDYPEWQLKEMQPLYTQPKEVK